jgi:AraC family transcriptional regulator of arabinose operon
MSGLRNNDGTHCNVSNRHQPCVVDQRVRHVLERLQDDPRLRPRQLAPFVRLSTSRLEHLFKQEVGTTIGQAAKELQLLRAKYLLETTFQSPKEVRYAVGITDAANFTRQFKERFGITPSACRAAVAVFTNR